MRGNRGYNRVGLRRGQTSLGQALLCLVSELLLPLMQMYQFLSLKKRHYL